MSKKYKFITNISKGSLQHNKLVLNLLKVDYKITQSLEFENSYSVYFLNEKENVLKLQDYFNLFSDLAREYRKVMVDSGFATEEEIGWRTTYMGCEKKYFPDRDNTILKEYIKQRKKVNDG